MNESTNSTEQDKNQTKDKTAEYISGHIDYSVIEGSAESNPMLLIPGFTEGRFVLRDFAETLGQESGRQVIYPDQPAISKQATNLPILDQHAEALLAIIEKEALTDKPVDIIAHSLGSLVAVRMAELAKERGIRSFDSHRGSQSIFIAPAGSNDKENLVYLGGRWLKFIQREANPTPLFSGLNRELDPTGEFLKAGQKNVNANLLKTVKEVLALAKKQRIYKGLGKLGLKPFVFGYAQDTLFPYKVVESALSANAENLAGYATPIDNTGVGAGSFSEFKARSGLKGQPAKKAWAHHYRNAGHNDLLFHPERTVRAILQVIEQ